MKDHFGPGRQLFGSEFLQEALNKQRNVFAALAERRELYRMTFSR